MDLYNLSHTKWKQLSTNMGNQKKTKSKPPPHKSKKDAKHPLSTATDSTSTVSTDGIPVSTFKTTASSVASSTSLNGAAAVNIDSHPIGIGRMLSVRYRDGSDRLAKVIERSEASPPGSGTWKYYVHYSDFNRRMDEWIPIAR